MSGRLSDRQKYVLDAIEHLRPQGGFVTSSEICRAIGFDPMTSLARLRQQNIIERKNIGGSISWAVIIDATKPNSKTKMSVGELTPKRLEEIERLAQENATVVGVGAVRELCGHIRALQKKLKREQKATHR